MTSIVACIGDLHFKTNNTNQTTEACTEIVNLIKELDDLKLIVVMGDVLDSHNRMYVDPFNRAYKFIQKLAKLSKVMVLVGNHDYINNSQFLSTQHSLLSFNNIKNVTVVDRVLMDQIDDCRLVFCPYVSPGRFEEALDTVENWNDANVIFAHQEIKGCRQGPIISTEGDEWPSNRPLVVSGHIHDSHWVNENVYYTGSSIQVAHGESGFKQLTCIKLNAKANSRRIVAIPLKVTQKRTYYLNCENFKKWKLPENVIAKIVVSGTAGEISLLERSTRYRRLVNEGVTISSRKVESVDELEDLNIEELESFESILDGLIDRDPISKRLKAMLRELS